MSETVKPNRAGDSSAAPRSYTLYQTNQPGTVLGWTEPAEEAEEPAAPPMSLPPLRPRSFRL